MKKMLLLCLAITLTGVFNATHSQELSNKALSAQYKYEIDALNSNIKTTKLKLKADQNNTELRSTLNTQQVKMKELQSEKKIIDKAIKSQSASEKAVKKAEKAARQADKAQTTAEKRERDAQRLRDSK